jgi:sodium-dependent phosphate transporter
MSEVVTSIISQDPQSFEWIRNAALCIAFIAAFGIGANDVANAYATSVGAKSLTIKQAIVLAAIFEFSGAYFMGAGVTDTVRKGIVASDKFLENPSMLMLGMLCALMSVSVWLLVASYFEMPVSTTHSVIGAIIGFSILAQGWDAVNWGKVGQVVISWFLSPILSGILAMLIFFVVRTFILRSAEGTSFKRATTFYPLLVAFTVALNIFLIIFKGSPGSDLKKLSVLEGVGYSLLIGVVLGLILNFTVVPFMIKKVEAMKFDEAGNLTDVSGDVEAGNTEMIAATTDNKRKESKKSTVIDKHNVHKVLEDKESNVSQMHDRAEVFDPKTEEIFKFLQVFTAMFDSFAHGANDVANSIGPLAAIVSIYENNGFTDAKVPVPDWILVLGGFGIVAGLALYGYKIISAIGVKLVKVTPSRGFAIELGAAFVIVTGAKLKLPLSTTHCQVGATVGLGLMEGRNGVNWWLLLNVFGGWVITLIIAGSLSALFFAFAAFSPSMVATCV